MIFNRPLLPMVIHYFMSDRNFLIGAAIYRSHRSGDSWSIPELVISGIVGIQRSPPMAVLMYFVHVLNDPPGLSIQISVRAKGKLNHKPFLGNSQPHYNVTR